MSERLIIFSPLFYIWSLFIAKKLRLLESIYQRLQGEERRGEESGAGSHISWKGLQVGDLYGSGNCALALFVCLWFLGRGLQEVLTSYPCSLRLDNGRGGCEITR